MHSDEINLSIEFSDIEISDYTLTEAVYFS